MVNKSLMSDESAGNNLIRVSIWPFIFIPSTSNVTTSVSGSGFSRLFASQCSDSHFFAGPMSEEAIKPSFHLVSTLSLRLIIDVDNAPVSSWAVPGKLPFLPKST